MVLALPLWDSVALECFMGDSVAAPQKQFPAEVKESEREVWDSPVWRTLGPAEPPPKER